MCQKFLDIAVVREADCFHVGIANGTRTSIDVAIVLSMFLSDGRFYPNVTNSANVRKNASFICRKETDMLC